MSTNAIQQMIADHFESLSPELQRAARWVSRHGSSLALHSMRDSARAAEVTPATMTRLARRLGFDGFEGLRAPFRRELAVRRAGAEFERDAQLRRRQCGRRSGRLAESLQQANVASVISLIRRARSKRAARMPARCDPGLFPRPARLPRRRHLPVLCLRTAGRQRHAGHRYRRHAERPGRADRRRQRAGRGQPVTLYAADGRGRRIRPRQAGPTRDRDDRQPLSPLARHAQQVLLYDTASTAHFHSTAGAQALAEALIAAVAARGGAAATAHLRRMQAHLQRHRRLLGTPW